MQETLLAEPSEEMLEADMHTFSHIVQEHRERAGLRLVALVLVAAMGLSCSALALALWLVIEAF